MGGGHARNWWLGGISFMRDAFFLSFLWVCVVGLSFLVHHAVFYFIFLLCFPDLAWLSYKVSEISCPMFFVLIEENK